MVITIVLWIFALITLPSAIIVFRRVGPSQKWMLMTWLGGGLTLFALFVGLVLFVQTMPVEHSLAVIVIGFSMLLVMSAVSWVQQLDALVQSGRLSASTDQSRYNDPIVKMIRFLLGQQR